MAEYPWTLTPRRTLPIIVWVQLRGRNAVAREFLQSSEGDRYGGEKLFFFLLGDRQSTWMRANHYVDLCCTKGVFAEPGWSSYGQKRIPRLEADRSAWWRKAGLSSRLKVYPAWFLQSYLLSQKPRGCNDTGKVLFMDAQRQTTRQRSRTTALARVHRLHRLSYPLMVHILPICIPSRQLYEKLSSW